MHTEIVLPHFTRVPEAGRVLRFGQNVVANGADVEVAATERVVRGRLRVLARLAGGAELPVFVFGPGQVLPAGLIADQREFFVRVASPEAELTGAPRVASDVARALLELLALRRHIAEACPALCEQPQLVAALSDTGIGLGLQPGQPLRLERQRGALALACAGDVRERDTKTPFARRQLEIVSDDRLELESSVPSRIALFPAREVARIRVQSPVLDEVCGRIEVGSRRRDSEPAPPVPLDAQHPACAPPPARVRRGRRFWLPRLPGFPHVAQIDSSDCGVACLAMLAKWHRRPADLALVRRLAGVSPDGLGLQSLCVTASQIGLQATAVKVSRANVSRLATPCIIHWGDNHWVVLIHCSRRHATIADPARGVLRIPRAELDREWDGHAALVDPALTDELPATPSAAPPLLLPRLSKEGRSLSLVVAMAMLAGAASLAPPMLNQILVDQVLVGGASGGIFSLLAVTAVVFVLLVGSQFLRAYLTAHVVARIDASLVSQLFARLLSLPLEYFMSRRNGDLQRRLRSIQQVRDLAVNRGIDGLLAVVQLACALVVVGVYSPAMITVYLMTTPLYAFAMWAALRAIRPTQRRLEEAHAKYESDQTDAIASILAVKSAGAEAYAHKHIVRSFARVARAEFGNGALVATYQALVRLLGFAASAAVLWRSATLVQNGQLTLGAFVALGTVSTMIGAPLLTLLAIWDESQRGRVLLDRVADVLTHPTEADPEAPWRAPQLRGRITLAGVTYRWHSRDLAERASAICSPF